MIASVPQVAGQGSYLLVLEGGTSRTVMLPTQGELWVGQEPSLPISLADPSIAPRHACFSIREGEVRVQVAEAGLEVLVNGVAVDGSRSLVSGDTIQLGNVCCTLHRDPRIRIPRQPLDESAFGLRLREEVERCLRTRRSASLVVVDATEDAAHGAEMLGVVANTLRMVDVVGWNGQTTIFALLPETGASAAVPIQRMLAALAAKESRARLGMADCPMDARDADGLMAAARHAALSARPGTCASFPDTITPVNVGDRTLVTADPLMQTVLSLVRRLAPSDMPVLVTGETGAGKELIAAALHAWSHRKDKPLVTINCAAITESLFESELFGHERGSFTGATGAKVGLLESADGGTVFLDEVGESSLSSQAKLLRVLETKRVTRVGAVRDRPVDIRIVAATNRSLEAEVAAGRFRQDLFYRLKAATVIVPPLRDRPLDISALCRVYLIQACQKLARAGLTFGPAAMQRLGLHDWPGNVRELRNLMDFLAATVEDVRVESEDLPKEIGATVAPWLVPGATPAAPTATPPPSTPPSSAGFRNIYEEIKELERSRMQQALEAADGVRVRAAEFIGMPLRTFVTKLKEYGLSSIPSQPRKGHGGG